MRHPGSTALALMNTDQVSPRDRIPYWSDWIDRLFNGLQSDQYGDLDFDGRMNASRAGDVILTRLEANRQASERPAIVNSACTPPSGEPSALRTRRASRTGPLAVMNEGRLLAAPSSVAKATCGLTGGLVPPIVGCE